MAKRIAIVEDDAAIRANYADALKKHGYEVSAYAARARSVQTAPQNSPHERDAARTKQAAIGKSTSRLRYATV